MVKVVLQNSFDKFTPVIIPEYEMCCGDVCDEYRMNYVH